MAGKMCRDGGEGEEQERGEDEEREARGEEGDFITNTVFIFLKPVVIKYAMLNIAMSIDHPFHLHHLLK